MLYVVTVLYTAANVPWLYLLSQCRKKYHSPRTEAKILLNYKYEDETHEANLHAHKRIS